MKSLHILADFYDCRGEARFLTQKGVIRKKILRIIRNAGFQIVASRFHKFADDAGGRGEGGITGVIIVAESHITIHTWPERRFVNIDVFFCNYTRDNTKRARAVFRLLKMVYRPRRIQRKEIFRD